MIDVVITVTRCGGGKMAQELRLSISELLDLQRKLNILTKDCYPVESEAADESEEK